MSFHCNAENEEGRLVPDLLLFLEKALYNIKESVKHLIFNIFWWTLIWTSNKNKFAACQTVDSQIHHILCMIFWGNVSHVILYCIAKFHYLIVFTSWDIRQYMYWNCLLTRLQCQKFWNEPCLSNQAAFLHDQNVKTKSWEQKELLSWNKKTFSIIFKRFSVAKLSQTWESVFKAMPKFPNKEQWF